MGTFSNEDRRRAKLSRRLNKLTACVDSGCRDRSSNSSENVLASKATREYARAATKVKMKGINAGSIDCSKQRFEQRVKRLSGGRFRMLNEWLYTKASGEVFTQFQANPQSFEDYHVGFSEQVSTWPSNPNDEFSKWLRSRGHLPLVVADFGCGVADIARTALPEHTVHSFDLVAANHRITACDIANVPLANESVDVSIFCLSLMGSNWPEFVREGVRVLKSGGVMKIAEVKSRFTDTKQFISALGRMGLRLLSQDTSNKMFVMLEFKREKPNLCQLPSSALLKPCIYKRR